MSSKTSGTKDEILRIGIELIRFYGYNAFSYADISSQLNIRNAAVHYHYKSKEDLLYGILDSYIEDYKALGLQMQLSGLSAAGKLDSFIERYSQLVEDNSICIIGSVASDYNTLPASVKDKVSELIQLVLGMVEKTLQEGKLSGEFAFEESARTATLLIMTNLAAGVQLARITGKKDYDAIRKAIVNRLK